MKAKERETLLKAVLPGDELTAFRQESLELGLSALRARQKRRRLLRAAAVGVILAVVAGGLLWESIRSPSTKRSSALADLARPSLPSKATAVIFISDDELLSLFPNRSVALVGKPGHQHLLLLDEGKEERGYN